MSLFQTLLQAVQSWRTRRGGGARAKAARSPGIAVERLDHRQLLAVNFTGNVITDFPATQAPGVVVLKNNPAVEHPSFLPNLALQNQIRVSGFDVNGIRLSYDSQADILSIGIDQPPNPKSPGREVIAGDADNNGNSGTVDPAVTALQPAFMDFPDLGGSEYLASFLDLRGTGTPDTVAGIGTGARKTYHVAQAVVNPGSNRPDTTFGADIPNATGNVYLVNDPDHPNFEFNINNFSKVYAARTGRTLTPQTIIGVGAYGGSNADFATEAFFPSQPVRISDATVPVPTPPTPVVCPPLEPPVLINPHEGSHIDTAHPTNIRVSVFGQARFDVTKIITSSVRLGGASPVFALTRHINKDPYLDATFVFKGTDVRLPPGRTDAHVTGTLTDGTTFDSVRRVFNRDYSFYSQAAIDAQQRRRSARGTTTTAAVDTLATRAHASHQTVKIERNPSIPTPIVHSVRTPRSNHLASRKGVAVPINHTVRTPISKLVASRTAAPAPIAETVYSPSHKPPAARKVAAAVQVAPRHRGIRMADMSKAHAATVGGGL